MRTLERVRAKRQLRPEFVDRPALELLLVVDRALERVAPQQLVSRGEQLQGQAEILSPAAERAGQQEIRGERLRLFGDGQSVDGLAVRTSVLDHAYFRPRRQQQAKTLAEVIGEVPGFGARICRLDRQHGHRRSGEGYEPLAPDKKRCSQGDRDDDDDVAGDCSPAAFAPRTLEEPAGDYDERKPAHGDQE